MGKGEKGKKSESAQQGSQAPVIEMCGAKTCNTKAARFGFCAEHYEQFKFGLIKKDGNPAADYEKKLDHYKDYVARKGLKQVA